MLTEVAGSVGTTYVGNIVNGGPQHPQGQRRA